MRSWSAPKVPRLPGGGVPLRLFDTAMRDVVPTKPGPTARMYVCGITPYDATHLGHANTYLAFDLVNRAWRDAGHEVHFTQNATDVDDPLLERAEQTGIDWRDLAEREIELFRSDMEALRILPPRDYVAVTEVIDQVADLIALLRDKGATYDLEGDVYFDAAAAPKFGAVSGYPEERMLDLFGERGGDPERPGKKHPLDWLLWRAERPGEPSWPSPFGQGRPGWHIECTAIALANLSSGFDVAGGGSDLIFPHHECGAHEGHVACGEWPFARAYVHAGMVALEGEKMSKSKGNLVFVSRLRGETDPMAIRLALLAHHYRSDWEWTSGQLASAEVRLARWRSAVGLQTGPDAGVVLDRVRARMADDLDAPGALAVIDDWAERALSEGGSDPGAPVLVGRIADALLGVAL
ncbi:cysteine--1-D-myo-inosityl 2-amino-2-deoxy-alpha-D-glucopyranoside ligase [Streptosporangium sp. NBC_01755]|uniref:cysteine--1-D-myo-inosityl 2-amino-2-deoxy-alpha-D-glucopyranoside ligase n=1 Tax=unclassified Streptosporangium TaxID=2632669 RepID=UPI002DDC3766|nr:MULTISPECIES: cysteine--1-D-myo-inosityl 2-amino-2-deoxy-alpha-D-glucopyranoside ligase [unclassified Streptosporangium]WSA29113.1 cysteine--1-D-myo-inosityl 2-amino-2-deoxy-alpha-D-glucopyranoside ligase [Streptosporangium sp. NBC_01810]WSC99441.1 cysteine--1-D-myo-inosityl 2-amino-2-deoxy-alpha-D-glucopyranoside ligase [Streptosporangium sp. NBC_01755]